MGVLVGALGQRPRSFPRLAAPEKCAVPSLAYTRLALPSQAQIDHLPAFPYSRWVWLATLAGAIYRGVPAQVRDGTAAGLHA